MAYTSKQRKLIAAEYRRALEMLPGRIGQNGIDRTSPYICDIINTHGRTNLFRPQEFDPVEAATDIITERIEHKFSLESWLKSQSDEIADAVRYDVNHNVGRKLQAYRMAWLKQLIKEFGGK
jgi:hypothetical protein